MEPSKFDLPQITFDISPVFCIGVEVQIFPKVISGKIVAAGFVIKQADAAMRLCKTRVQTDRDLVLVFSLGLIAFPRPLAEELRQSKVRLRIFGFPGQRFLNALLSQCEAAAGYLKKCVFKNNSLRLRRKMFLSLRAAMFFIVSSNEPVVTIRSFIYSRMCGKKEWFFDLLLFQIALDVLHHLWRLCGIIAAMHHQSQPF